MGEGGGSAEPSEETCDLMERWGRRDLKLLPLDLMDIKILCLLKENSRRTNSEVAVVLGSTEATIRRRIQRLMSRGIITGFSTYINYSMMENTVKAYVQVEARQDALQAVIDAVARHRRVVAVYRVTGKANLLLVGLFTSMADLQSFIDADLKIEGVVETSTQIVMSAPKGVPWTGL